MSIQLELTVTNAKPVFRGHDHYWSVIRDLGKDTHFTRQEVALRSNDTTDRCIDDFLGRLIKAGYVEVVGTQSSQSPHVRNKAIRIDVLKLVRRPKATPILNRDGSVGTQGLGQLNMWTAMRSLSQFAKQELAITATTDEVNVSVSTALRYARSLESAGYLQIVRPGGAAVARIWRLKPSMNTGPKAPKIFRSKMVYDANREAFMGQPVAEECAA